MRRTKISLPLAVAAAAAAAVSLGTPTPARAQSVLQRIKTETAKRVEQRKAKVDSAVVKTATGAVDSTLDKTGRAADAVVNKVGSVTDTAITRTEHGVRNAFNGGDASNELAARFAVQLASGHAVVREIRFAPNSDQLDPSSAGALAQLAKAVVETPGIFLIEGHTDVLGTPAAAQALSEQRAAAVKGRLVAEGVPAARLLAVGYGATRPPSDGGADGARIELTRAQ